MWHKKSMPTLSQLALRTRETLGFLCQRLPLICLTLSAGTIVNAKAIITPPVNIGGQDVQSVFLDTKVLYGILLTNALHIIFALVKSIRAKENKQLEEILKKVDLIPSILAKQEQIDERLEYTPTFDQVELMVLRQKGRQS